MGRLSKGERDNGISGKIKNPKVRQMFLNCFST